MTDSGLMFFAERELKYQARKEISNEIRKNGPEGDPMVTGITVMLGTGMAVFERMLSGGSRGRRATTINHQGRRKHVQPAKTRCPRGKAIPLPRKAGAELSQQEQRAGTHW